MGVFLGVVERLQKQQPPTPTYRSTAQPMALTDVAIRNAKPTEKQQKLFDGGGLHLLVTPAGGKRWVLKYRFGGKEKTLALGPLCRRSTLPR